MESFFHTPEVERVHHRVSATRAGARSDVFVPRAFAAPQGPRPPRTIEGLCTSRRLHSALGYGSPADMKRMAP
jgi:hypothetical protein